MGLSYKNLAEFQSRVLDGNDLDSAELAQVRAEAYGKTANSAKALHLLRYYADKSDLVPLSSIVRDEDVSPILRTEALTILCDNLMCAKEFEPLIIQGLQEKPESFLDKLGAAQMSNRLLKQARSAVACNLLIEILYDNDESIYTREAAYLALLAGAGLSHDEIRKIDLSYVSQGFNPNRDVDPALIDRARRNQLIN